jgi:hypothetical protein
MEGTREEWRSAVCVCDCGVREGVGSRVRDDEGVRVEGLSPWKVR